MPEQKIYAFICTRSRELSKITETYVRYLASCQIIVKLLINQNSIFEGYKKAFEKVNPNPKDIIILSHDDIEIKMPFYLFVQVLKKNLKNKTGFVGPAGTTFLGKDSTWWNIDNWKNKMHRGRVYHINKDTKKLYDTYYGENGQVVVLDGLFLATKAEVLLDIGLDKPDYLEGDWDFYDIHYTSAAHFKGYKNKTIPLTIIHHSGGELAGRDSWFKNRDLFEKKYVKEFPIKC